MVAGSGRQRGRVAAGQAGCTLVELTCAFVVVAVLGLGIGLGGRQHASAVVDGFCRTVAVQAAQSRLEELRHDRASLVPGETEFALDQEERRRLPDASGRQSVRRREPGLLEVTVEVRWPGGRSRLTTLLGVAP